MLQAHPLVQGALIVVWTVTVLAFLWFIAITVVYLIWRNELGPRWGTFQPILQQRLEPDPELGRHHRLPGHTVLDGRELLYVLALVRLQVPRNLCVPMTCHHRPARGWVFRAVCAGREPVAADIIGHWVEHLEAWCLSYCVHDVADGGPGCVQDRHPLAIQPCARPSVGGH